MTWHRRPLFDNGRFEMRSSDRRRFLVLVGAVVGAGLNGCMLAATSRQSRSVPAIGYLSTGSASSPTQAAYKAAFLDGLRELGYLEGQTINIEWRFSDQRTDPSADLEAMAADLVALGVQVIVTSSTPAVVAAANTTKTIPIISGGPSRGLTDLGLVNSDARPGRNVTGTGGNTQVYGKLVELLKEAVPNVTRVGYLRDPTTPGTEQQMARSQTAASQLGLDFLELQARTVDDIDAAISSAASAGANGLVVSADNLFGPSTPDDPVVRDPLMYHLPAIYSQVAGYVDAGGLMAYSPDFVASQRRAAAYVDKILRGARPAELPVEQAMTFAFGINLKTAQALGINIPQSVLLQATQVIR
jgi:putative ABC transport system substrate-binding protein